MTFSEALQQGYEVKVKTGYIDDQFIQNRITLLVTVVKDGRKGIKYSEFSEADLEDFVSVNYIIEAFIGWAIEDYESNSLS